MHSIIYYAQDQNHVSTQVHSISIEIISTTDKEKEDAIAETYTIRAPTISVIDEESKVKEENNFLENAMSIPTAKIESISSSGQVKIAFSKPMKVVDLEMYAKKVDRNLRFLNEKPLDEEPEIQNLWKLIQHELFEVKIQQKSQADDLVNLAYDWVIKDFSHKTLHISLQFAKPVSVSSSSDGYDTLTLKIKDSSFFTDTYGYQVDSKIEISA